MLWREEAMGRTRSTLVSCFCALTTLVGTAYTQTISYATVQNLQNRLTLPDLSPASESLVYIYGFGTGGDYPSTNLSSGVQAGLIPSSGFLNAGLALTTNNSASFATRANYYTIGGVAVSNFTGQSTYLGKNNAAGAVSASTSFTVTQASLAVVVAIAGGQSSLTISGLPGFSIDSEVSRPLGGVIAMAIGHALLWPGSYTASEKSSPSPAPGQDPRHQTDLIGVFVFTAPNSATLRPCVCRDGHILYSSVHSHGLQFWVAGLGGRG
jgi:hypothetical protein